MSAEGWGGDNTIVFTVSKESHKNEMFQYPAKQKRFKEQQEEKINLSMVEREKGQVKKCVISPIWSHHQMWDQSTNIIWSKRWRESYKC
jgi:hypothetical protein